MVLVALAGPGMNILLACASRNAAPRATPVFRQAWRSGGGRRSPSASSSIWCWPSSTCCRCRRFDGGRVVHGLLPPRHAERFARLERFGIIAVLVAFFIVPLIAAEFGSAFNPLAAIVLPPTAAGFELIVEMFGVEALVSWADLTPFERRRRAGRFALRPLPRSRRRRAAADRQSRRLRGAARPAAYTRPHPEGRPRAHLHSGACRAVSGLRHAGAGGCASSWNARPATWSWRRGSPTSSRACSCPTRSPTTRSRAGPRWRPRSPSGCGAWPRCATPLRPLMDRPQLGRDVFAAGAAEGLPVHEEALYTRARSTSCCAPTPPTASAASRAAC